MDWITTEYSDTKKYK